MYFNKIRHPSNFSFAQSHTNGSLAIGAKPVQATVRDLGEDVFHVELRDANRWPLDARVLPLHDDAFAGTDSRYQLAITDSGNLVLNGAGGEAILSGIDGACLGACGSAWLVQFARNAEMRFFGQGEKVTGLEKTGKRTKYWNADVWADHAMHTIETGQADPQYAAVPYLLVRQGEQWVGILVDHPGAVFMDTGSN